MKMNAHALGLKKLRMNEEGSERYENKVFLIISETILLHVQS